MIKKIIEGKGGTSHHELVDVSEEVKTWTMTTTPFVESCQEKAIEQRRHQAGNDEVESYRNNR
jgi:hypothetical protein